MCVCVFFSHIFHFSIDFFLSIRMHRIVCSLPDFRALYRSCKEICEAQRKTSVICYDKWSKHMTNKYFEFEQSSGNRRLAKI